MKIRQGFVSNSSSSSFIVAVKDEDKAEVTITLEADLHDFADETIRTEEELEQHLKDDWGTAWREEDYPMNLFNSCIKEINKGNVILFGRVCTDSGNLVETCLCENGIPKTKGIKIIQNAER